FGICMGGFFCENAEVAEWSIVLVCKTSVRKDYEGSNPSLSTDAYIKTSHI
ncbi:MAG: hypothetical protein ACD_48C00054G0002, partial [uncultured bacterium]